MNPLVDDIIAGIGTHDPEAFLGAAMVAESVGLRGAKPVPPYDELLQKHPPSIEDVQALRQMLLSYVQSDYPLASSALYALGKFYDPALAPLFREKLAIELQAVLEHNRALCILIIALENSRERIITTGVQSPFEVDRSIGHARDYLKRFGQQFPW